MQLLRIVAMVAICSPALAAGSVATSINITSVMSEPSLPFENATVNLHVANDLAQMFTTIPLAEVRGDDGSYAQCFVNPNGDAFCLMTFDAPATVTLTAKFFGDATFAPSTTSASHTVAAPLTLSAPLGGTVGQVWTMTGAGLTPNGSVTVDYGDLSLPASVSTNGTGQATMTHTFVLEGLYIVTVTDSAASKTSRVVVNMFAGAPPGTLGNGLGTVYAPSGAYNGETAINATVDEVGLMPTGPAVISSGIYATDPTPTPLDAPAFTYDVRARNVVSGANVTIWVTYPSTVTGPELAWFNRGTMKYEPVLSSGGSSLKIDPVAHTIEVQLSDTSTPKISQLTGTVLATHTAPPPPDMAGVDASSPDDAGTAIDAATDGPGGGNSGGCSCGLAASATSGGAGALAFALVALALILRRRA